MMIAGIYARVSSDRQKEEHTLPPSNIQKDDWQYERIGVVKHLIKDDLHKVATIFFLWYQTAVCISLKLLEVMYCTPLQCHEAI